MKPALKAAVLGVSLVLTGCLLPGQETKSKPGGDFNLTDGSRSHGRDSISEIQHLSTASPDPIKGSLVGVKIDVYAISVPRGAVSANEVFWKRVDEDALIDRARYDRLFANGFRVGVARADQWDYFKETLERTPARYEQHAVTVTDEQSVEVPVRKGVAEQKLSYFSENEPLEIKTYTDSDNLLSFTFVPAPRRADACRVALSPVVRSTRERLDYTLRNDEVLLKYKTVERLYELNFAAEIPFGEFLVVSPSTDTAHATSIGRNFLLLDDEAEQHELVLLIVPNKVDLKPAEPQKPDSKK